MIRLKDMRFYGVSSQDLDGIVEQMRVTKVMPTESAKILAAAAMCGQPDAPCQEAFTMW